MMVLDNDTRGWIMTVISGVACVLGASVICADIIIRQFPGKKNFRIEDSDVFLSSSLSLSFGVMLFSALYKMLPSAQKSLAEGGLSSRLAAWVLILCFLGGVIGIQILSRVLHHYIPSHIVDCEHTHDEEDPKEHGHNHENDHSDPHAQAPTWTDTHPHRDPNKTSHRSASETSTQVLPSYFTDAQSTLDSTRESERAETFMTAKTRPSLKATFSRTLSKLRNAPADACQCEPGTCYGYTEPCGQECFKNVQSRTSDKPIRHTMRLPRKPNAFRSPLRQTESTPLLSDHEQASGRNSRTAPSVNQAKTSAADTDTTHSNQDGLHDPDDHAHHRRDSDDSSHTEAGDEPQQHHHHVPTNAFLSIGLQTSIAIALHKLPEGFITFATNHANPKLGFSVFLALFIHNITEGFAMALPLYLAVRSRPKAMFWSSLLGGFSQPLGAGVAALWFHIAGNSDMAPGEAVYGGMFAVTAGIMTSVALQLFSESLDFTHNRGLCIIFAFVGMGVMGASSALTA